MNTQAAISANTSVTTQNATLRRAWPWAVVATGFLVNGAWIALLGYGLVKAAHLIF